MSSIPQNYCDENELIDCVQRFFSRHHVGKLLAKCNGMKEKGVSPVSLLRYKLSNIFVGRSMYMQQRTGSFERYADDGVVHCRTKEELLDSQPGYMALIVSDLLDKQIKVFYAAPVFDDGFRLTGLEVFQSIDVISHIKFFKAHILFSFLQTVKKLDKPVHTAAL